jgi:hypothetical protein
MFDQLATALGGPNALFQEHPQTLSLWLEEAWGAAALPPTLVPVPGTLDDVLGDRRIIGAIGLPPPPPASGLLYPGGSVFLWNALLYAYLLEATGVVEVVAEVLRRYTQGETLPVPSIGAQRWLRSTEDLFFRDPPLFQAIGIGSHIRPYSRESRRGAYWRMYNLDMPFPVPPRWRDPVGGQPWKLDVGVSGANTAFRQQWREFLHQVWLGIENRRNLVGANATDQEYVAQLCLSIGDMLRMRRQGGQLAREEATYVAMLSWFAVTLSENTPIVRSLGAIAETPEERLSRIAQRVGMTPTARSRELFQLAIPASDVIRLIELHAFDTAAQAAVLFPVVPNAVSNLLNTVIDLWQSATGEMVKEPRVTVSSVGGPSQPARLPSPSEPMRAAGPPMAQPGALTGNGRGR